MDILTFLSHYTGDVLLIALVVVALFVLLVPLSLKLAGLTGEQIKDVLAMTWQMFIQLVSEFRQQNANKSDAGQP